MLKKDEMSDPNSCLNKAAEDEPVFVLRAQDLTAPEVIREWVARASAYGMISKEKSDDALAVAALMEMWPHRRFPD